MHLEITAIYNFDVNFIHIKILLTLKPTIATLEKVVQDVQN